MKAIALLLICLSCAKDEGPSGKVLNLATPQRIKGMDPIFSNDLASAREVAKIYEGLLEYHYTQRPYILIPNLAQSMPQVSKDGLTYTFKIKQGVFFQDDPAFPQGKGRQLVAGDFVYSLKRLADSKLQSSGWWILKNKIVGLDQWRKTSDYRQDIDGLKALDRYTLQFKLTRPSAQFLYALAMPFTFAVAQEVVAHYGAEFLNHPVGTGPFVLEGPFQAGQGPKIVYRKNPNFREKFSPQGGRLPFLDKIVVQVIEEDQPRWLKFKKGHLDVMEILQGNFEMALGQDNKVAPSLEKQGVELLISPGADITYIGLNHDLKIFQDVRVRRAFMLAYDVEKSNQLFHNGLALAAHSIVPPDIVGHNPHYRNPYRKKNLAKARQLLAQAGYPEGRGFPELTYDTSSKTVLRQMGEFAKAQLAPLGIQVRVVSNSWPRLLEKINNRSFMLYAMAWRADYPDGENFFQLLYGPHRSPGANGSGYNNPEFNHLFEQSLKAQNPSQRNELYQKMFHLAAEDVPLLYKHYKRNFALKHKYLKRFVNDNFVEVGREQYLDVDMEQRARVLESL